MSDWLTLKNMLGLTIRPIDVWPGNLRGSWERERGPYSAPLKDTLGVLKKELNFLRATDIILQIAIPERGLRLDGLPRAGAVAEHPGVIISFCTPKGPKRRAFDQFTRWEHNLRALALNLEHLRLANLYGVEADDVQYAGWRAITDGSENPVTPEEEAARYLLSVANTDTTSGAVRRMLDDPDRAIVVIRTAQANAHPDRGGDMEMVERVQAAAALLKERHGL